MPPDQPASQLPVPAVPAPDWVPTDLGAAALDAARAFARTALSDATRRAYAADWAHFVAWCAAAGAPDLPAPPAAVAAYLAAIAPTHGRATLCRRLAAIGARHRAAGAEWMPSHPAIRVTLRGLLRAHGAPPRQAAALGTAEVRRMVTRCEGGLTGTRDRALLPRRCAVASSPRSAASTSRSARTARCGC